MIVTEYFKAGERDFIRTYSDAGCYVVREGVEYVEACDPEEYNRAYTEGKPMPIEERIEALTNKAEAYDILMGVSE